MDEREKHQGKKDLEREQAALRANFGPIGRYSSAPRHQADREESKSEQIRRQIH